MGTDHLATMIRESVRMHAARPAMRWQAGGGWTSMTYAELGARIDAVAQGLLAAGVREGERVGICSRNVPAWTIADLAIQSVRAVTVPIYATNTAQQVEHVTRDAELALLFVGEQEQYDKVEAFRSGCPGLRQVVALEPETRIRGAGSLQLDDLVRRGASALHGAELAARLGAVRPDDVATIVYTSGTTGDPRGAVLTQANVFHQFRALDAWFEVGPADRSLCFLPLSHAYERAWTWYVLRQGAENAYLANPRDVAATLPDVRPTVMVSVPRLYEKICAAVLDRARRGSRPKQVLFRWAMGTGRAFQERRRSGRPVGALLALRHRIADALVLSKIRAAIGGDKKFLSSGGAPLSKEIEEFFFAAGVLICQGYGLTETAPMVTANAPGAFRFGTVGRPVLGCELRIGRGGEVLVRGPNVMQGYFRKPAETAEVFEDGWFRTGDLGAIDEDGFLRITGRIKDLIITSQGKNIAPQRIEAMFASDPYIEHVAVIGDRRSHVAALVVPSFPTLERHARESGIPFSSRAELVRRPEVVALYEARLRDRSTELASWERIKQFALVASEFSQEGGELTPTQKIRRSVVERKYGALIDAMYEGAA